MPSFDANDCAQVFARLSDWADRELAPDDLAAIEAHLEVCDRCGGEFVFEQRTLDAIKRVLRRAPVADGLRERVLERLRDASD